jgi:hypothetical protein
MKQSYKVYEKVSSPHIINSCDHLLTYRKQLVQRYIAHEPRFTTKAAVSARQTEIDSLLAANPPASRKSDLEHEKKVLGDITIALGPYEDAVTALKTATTELDTEKDKKADRNDAEVIRLKTIKESKEQDLGKAKQEVLRVESEDTDVSKEEQAVVEALESMYKYDKEAQQARKLEKKEEEAAALDNLLAAKNRWLTANSNLQAAGTKNAVLKLEAGGVAKLEKTIKGHIDSLDAEIAATESQLAAGNSNIQGAIIGVSAEKALIRDEGIMTNAMATATATQIEQSADVWTKVAFSVGAKNDKSSTSETNISGQFNVEVGNWFAKVKASSSFSSSSKKLETSMSDCRIEGSFSAMVVNIKRPWLHGDLFNDFDIDIPTGTQLSPGADIVKNWIEKGEDKNSTFKRTDYGKFPAYPTAFIVAADTVLEVSTHSAMFLLPDFDQHNKTAQEHRVQQPRDDACTLHG